MSTEAKIAELRADWLEVCAQKFDRRMRFCESVYEEIGSCIQEAADREIEAWRSERSESESSS